MSGAIDLAFLALFPRALVAWFRRELEHSAHAEPRIDKVCFGPDASPVNTPSPVATNEDGMRRLFRMMLLPAVLKDAWT